MKFDLRIGVVVWPDAATSAEVNKIREKYDAHYHGIGPHITVAFGQYLKQPIEEIKAGMARAASAVAPFVVTMERWVGEDDLMKSHPVSTRYLIDNYPNARNLIVLLASKGNAEMLTMRRAFHKIIPQPDLLLDYPLYMTLGQTLSDEAFAAAKKDLAHYHPNIRFSVAGFDLLAEQADGTWPVVETYLLRG